MTPYEEDELGLAVQTYAQKENRALEIFARLRTLRNEVGYGWSVDHGCVGVWMGI